MSESGMRYHVNKGLRKLDALAVENPTRPGTPDINYVEGWIELKELREWPAQADSNPVEIRHFSLQQRIWLQRRRRFGGNAFFLLKVGREWLLFDGAVAAEHIGKRTRPELLQLAIMYWPSGINFEELIVCLTPTSASA